MRLQLGYDGLHEIHVVKCEEIDCGIQSGYLVIGSEKVVLAQLLNIGISLENYLSVL